MLIVWRGPPVRVCVFAVSSPAQLPRSPMSFSSLRQAEVQLIMHRCDLHSLLTLARCCRFTLGCASSDFALQCLPPVVVYSIQPDLAGSIARSLVRFAPALSLRLLRVQSGCEAATTAMFSLPRLTGLVVPSQPFLNLMLFVPRKHRRALRTLRWHSTTVPTEFTFWFDYDCALEDLTLHCVPHKELFISLDRLSCLTALDLQFDQAHKITDKSAASIGRR